MKVGFIGLTHLGQTMKTAAELRGMATEVDNLASCDLVMVTQDVGDHDDLKAVDACMEQAMALPGDIPIVLVSQVPPGYTRRWVKYRPSNRYSLFYQVDTLIIRSALRRAVFPERIIYGVNDPNANAFGSAAYREYLRQFECPLFPMTLESAEFCKLAINYYLASQINTANKLSAIAAEIGADWDEIVPGLWTDARIGNCAYLVPGKPEGHLPRDLRTIDRLWNEMESKRKVA